MTGAGRRCLVLDLDDTVFLELDYVRSGFAAVGEHVASLTGWTGFADAAWERFEAGERGTIFDEVLAAAPGVRGRVAIADLVTVYREHAPAIELLPDAARLLRRVGRREDIVVAVVTDGHVASQRAKALAVGGIGDGSWSALTVLTAELGPGFGKPHPRAFEVVQERLGVPPGACTYVADNPTKDFAGPRRLGWHTVRVRRPLGLHHEVPSGDDVDEEVDDLGRLAVHDLDTTGVGPDDAAAIAGAG